MQVVILCGGLGTRLSEETNTIPKPMVLINEKPIIEHIMMCYSRFGFKEFILAGGYKSLVIKKYFLDYNLDKSNVDIDFSNNTKKIKFNKKQIDWKIKIIDSGISLQTGARLKFIKNFLNKTDDNFFMTYGDGVGNINIKKLLKFHEKNNKIATMTVVRPQARFGSLILKSNKVIKFKEKDKLSEGWINGGFFVLNKKIFNYLNNKSDCIFEREPLENISKNGQLMAYKHEGFWHPMDTLRDKRDLNNFAKLKKVPWLV